MSAQTRATSQEFPTAEPISATIRVGGGSVLVTAEERTTAAVTVAPADGSEASRHAADEAEVTFHDGKLHVETNREGNGLFRRSGQVRVELRVPLDSHAEVQVGSADIRTYGRLADVAVNSGSGDTQVALVTGLLRAETGSGDVRGDEVGELRANTGSGDVSVTRIAGDAQVKTASGDVRVDEVGGSLQANTASGDVSVRAARGGGVDITTASGDALVGVPAGTRVWLDLSTASGRTTSDLAMTDTPTEGAQLNLVVRTASGDITLRRAAPTSE